MYGELPPVTAARSPYSRVNTGARWQLTRSSRRWPPAAAGPMARSRRPAWAAEPDDARAKLWDELWDAHESVRRRLHPLTGEL